MATTKAKRHRTPEQFRGMVCRMIRSYARYVATTGNDDDIRQLVALIGETEQAVGWAMGDLRRQGFSSSTIADALGVSSQAVRKRWWCFDERKAPAGGQPPDGRDQPAG